MNEIKTKGLTNLNSDENIFRDTCVSLARMYFSQFAAISCFYYFNFLRNRGIIDNHVLSVGGCSIFIKMKCQVIQKDILEIPHAVIF